MNPNLDLSLMTGGGMPCVLQRSTSENKSGWVNLQREKQGGVHLWC